MRNLLLAGAAILFAAPAVAADLPTKKAPIPIPVVTAYDWTGFYFGGNLGYAWGSSNYTTYSSSTGVFADSGSDNLNSFIGGGQIGYRYMFLQRFVIGAEASLDWYEGNSNNNSNYASHKLYDWSTYSSGLGGNVVGTVGYAWGDFLPYVKGGWAWTNSTVTHYQTYGTIGGLNPNPLPVAEQANLYRSGWTIGGGLSYHIWQNWEVFGQYMYANYGTGTLNYISSQRKHTNLAHRRISLRSARTSSSDPPL